jgi:hypothetical protein
MLEFNGRKFARTTTEPAAGTEIHGFCKRERNGWKLYDMQRQLQAFLVDNAHKERFIVTAYTFAGDGRDRFMFSTTTATERWLGIEGWTMAQERAEAEAAVARLLTPAPAA